MAVTATREAPRAIQPPVRPVFSVVAPVYNEEQLLPEFYARVVRVMEGLGEPFELVLVNDGSRDRCIEIMRELHTQDPRVRVVNFSRNFGHQMAITAGTDYASGDAVIVIDSDLQDPPEVIADLVAQWREGYQVVYAQRRERAGETWFKRITASFFYRLIGRIAKVNIPPDTGDFRLMDRKVVDQLKQMREHSRFMRGLSVWVGFRQTGILYDRAARKAGATAYSLNKMVRLAFDAITSFSYVPLQMATAFGFITALISVIGILLVVAVRVAALFVPALQNIAPLEGQGTTLVVVLFLGGVQMIFLGIIGEYLGRIYDEVKRRPLYVVAETLGFDSEKG